MTLVPHVSETCDSTDCITFRLGSCRRLRRWISVLRGFVTLPVGTVSFKDVGDLSLRFFLLLNILSAIV